MEFFLIGLGNPDDYIGTPHNIGKDFIVGLVNHTKHQWHKLGKGRVSSLLIGPHIVACAVSDGYMNETGTSLGDIFHHVDPSRVLVIHDETDLPVGVAKVSYNKRPGGHKGVSSIADALGTNAFFRLRVGIGRHERLSEYVLSPLSKQVARSITASLKEVFPHALATMAMHHAPAPAGTDPSAPA